MERGAELGDVGDSGLVGPAGAEVVLWNVDLMPGNLVTQHQIDSVGIWRAWMLGNQVARHLHDTCDCSARRLPYALVAFVL